MVPELAYMDVCALSDVSDEAIFHAEVAGKQIILIKRGNEIYALDGVCTHEYAELWNGFVSDDTITCPLHLSQFDIKTGEVLSPPAEQPLQVYSVKIEDNRVLIDFPTHSGD
jgi:3-phenylpropionate/trans-cinnamate dioxygenase ferredoxin subunit